MTDAKVVTSARALLVTWANEQDHWVRGIASEVFETRKALSESRIEHFYSQYLSEKELSDEAPKPNVPPLAWDNAEAEESDSLSLTSLSGVQGVNALAADQVLAFNPRMTIVFGENGAGKTGYVRILKRIADVRTAEDILPNIRGTAGSASVAGVIKYHAAGKDAELSWAGMKGVHPFTRIDVFDSRAVELHVDDDLTYVYTPADIALFRHVHQAAEGVKSRLEAARQARNPKANPFISRFSKESDVFAKIETLGATSDMGQLSSLANVTEEEELSISALKERIEALRSQTPEARARSLKADLELLGKGSRVCDALRSFDAVGYDSAVSKRALAEAKHKQASDTAFEGLDMPGVLSESWQGFIRAAHVFANESHGHAYPKENGDRCLYCDQPLSAAALALLHKYREFCNGELQREAETARADVQRRATALDEVDPTGLQLAVGRRDGSSSKAFDALVALLPSAENIQAALKAARPIAGAFSELAMQASSTAQLIGTEKSETEQLLSNFAAQAEARNKLLAEELRKLRNLEARLLLRELLSEIEQHVSSIKWAERVRVLVSSRFPPLLRSLTDVSKQASERLLNEDFETRFRAECEALRAPAVRLDFPGKKGQPARRKVLSPGHRLSDILSEGEQKAIALADFLAEASLKHGSSPIVLDDPVTSLDYKRHLHVADRLVRLSDKRQVVVFTHNIWFTMELLSRFEKKPDQCAYFSVGVVGIGALAKGAHPRADTFKTVKARLNNLLQDAKKAQGETLEALIERGYELLRGLCEVIVEADLLQEVVQRYQPNIRMGALSKIKPQALGPAMSTINDVFERACRYIASHSQPLETLNTRPSLHDLQSDWDAVQKARDAYLAAN